MKRHLTRAAGILLIAALAVGHAAGADFEVTGPDGRRILLKDDGTWRYVEAKDKAPPKGTELSKGKPESEQATKDKEQAKDKPKPTGEASLQLERKTEVSGGSCRFGLRLANNYPFQIRQFVPSFSAYRSNGAIYDTVSAGFFAIKPGNNQFQEILFRGIPCEEIVRVQVVGGDRCQIGDMDRFDFAKGRCLEAVRVVASELVRFDK